MGIDWGTILPIAAGVAATAMTGGAAAPAVAGAGAAGAGAAGAGAATAEGLLAAEMAAAAGAGAEAGTAAAAGTEALAAPAFADAAAGTEFAAAGANGGVTGATPAAMAPAPTPDFASIVNPTQGAMPAGAPGALPPGVGVPEGMMAPTDMATATGMPAQLPPGASPPGSTNSLGLPKMPQDVKNGIRAAQGTGMVMNALSPQAQPVAGGGGSVGRPAPTQMQPMQMIGGQGPAAGMSGPGTWNGMQSDPRMSLGRILYGQG